MSKIGKKPIPLPSGVEARIEEGKVKVKGPKGELELKLPSLCEVALEEGKLLVKRKKETREAKALHGTYRSLLNNMIVGVSQGFEKILEIVGIGYRGKMEGKDLVLTLGFSHPVRYTPPSGVKVELLNPTTIRVWGVDKQKVGQVAAEIRGLKKPEPYKGKGIRYRGEVIRLKAGKAALGAKKGA